MSFSKNNNTETLLWIVMQMSMLDKTYISGTFYKCTVHQEGVWGGGVSMILI